MCPSFRATGRERDLTRGRANTLRLALSGQLGPDALTSDDMARTMALCVGCKGCRRECPTGVDMARMKVEFLHHYKARRGLTLRDRLVSSPAALRAPAGAARPVAQRRRALRSAQGAARARHRLLPPSPAAGLAGATGSGRRMPGGRRAGSARPCCSRTASTPPSSRRMRARPRLCWRPPASACAIRAGPAARGPPVAGGAGWRPGESTGRGPRCAAPSPCCCPMPRPGRRLSGWSRPACSPSAMSCRPCCRDRKAPASGTAPSCWRAWFRKERRRRGWRNGSAPCPKAARSSTPIATARASTGRTPCWPRSRWCRGWRRRWSRAPCCGMAGSFGYEAEHYEISMKMAEAALLPAVRAEGRDTLIAADGTSCRHQIADGAGRAAEHPARILERALA